MATAYEPPPFGKAAITCRYEATRTASRAAMQRVTGRVKPRPYAPAAARIRTTDSGPYATEAIASRERAARPWTEVRRCRASGSGAGPGAGVGAEPEGDGPVIRSVVRPVGFHTIDIVRRTSVRCGKRTPVTGPAQRECRFVRARRFLAWLWRVIRPSSRLLDARRGRTDADGWPGHRSAGTSGGAGTRTWAAYGGGHVVSGASSSRDAPSVSRQCPGGGPATGLPSRPWNGEAV